MNRFFRQFIQLEMASSILLGIATLLAFLLSNSPLSKAYSQWIHSAFQLGHWHISLLHVINDGLMVLFFLLVSLEIKREFLEGQLQHRKQALLPLIAALGGVLVPAAFYWVFNADQPETLRGWAIPTATDIAFSLGVLSLLGKRIPLSLKLFLTALAVIDDLAAILIIAIFYTQAVQWHWLSLALLMLGILGYLNIAQINRLPFYLLGGIVLWFCVLQAGIHATVAGVLLGFVMPFHRQNTLQTPSLLHQLEQNLHPWVAYGVLPSFAFANAGLSLSGVSWAVTSHPLFIGIFTGLLFGKPLGILLTSWLAVKTGVARLPSALTWRHMSGVALLGGIGFTMSLFMGTLAFSEDTLLNLVQLGVFSSSLLAAVAAWLLLRR